MTVDARYLAWAGRALDVSGVAAGRLVCLGHNENLTFRVEDASSSGSYLLRLHQPVSAAFVGMRQRPDVIASECAWLEALACDTSLAVQAPRCTLAGEFVTLIEAAGVGPIPVTLLRWLDGQPLRSDVTDAEQQPSRSAHSSPTCTRTPRIGLHLKASHAQRTILATSHPINPDEDHVLDYR